MCVSSNEREKTKKKNLQVVPQNTNLKALFKYSTLDVSTYKPPHKFSDSMIVLLITNIRISFLVGACLNGEGVLLFLFSIYNLSYNLDNCKVFIKLFSIYFIFLL